MELVWLEETESTNSWLKEHSESPPMTLVAAVSQTAGRGQRGNTWEAEPGKNLTFSFRFKPRDVRPAEQFAVSEAVALAVRDTLSSYGIEAEVKWPNDIYVGDRKICGILIENSIMGLEIAQSIVGVGLNVNQREFLSDAPNPVSMAQLTGRDYSLQEVAQTFGRNFERRAERLKENHAEYKEALWRRDGEWPFMEKATAEKFSAVIEDVELTGHLLLRTGDSVRRYAFKEVEFLGTRYEVRGTR